MAKVSPAIPLPAIEVLERAVVDPFGAPSSPVDLRDPALVTHWCNTELAGGSQLHKALDAGYLQVRPEYLAHPDRFQFQVSPEGYVTRGPRHQEILMYTTKVHKRRRAWAKTQRNLKDMKVTTAAVQEAAAQHFGKDGDQAADFIGRHVGPVGGVSDSYERIAVEPKA